MIKVDLKGSEKEFESGVSVAEVAKSIGMGLYKSACAAKVNGEVCDLRTVLNEDCKVEILTFDDKEGKKAYWHTASHIMAQAVNRLYPGTKFAIGPAVDNGFYYDMELPQAITNDDLAKIEAEMKKIIKEDIEIERFELPVAEALELRVRTIKRSSSVSTLPRASTSPSISRAISRTSAQARTSCAPAMSRL